MSLALKIRTSVTAVFAEQTLEFTADFLILRACSASCGADRSACCFLGTFCTLADRLLVPSCRCGLAALPLFYIVVSLCEVPRARPGQVTMQTHNFSRECSQDLARRRAGQLPVEGLAAEWGWGRGTDEQTPEALTTGEGPVPSGSWDFND